VDDERRENYSYLLVPFYYISRYNNNSNNNNTICLTVDIIGTFAAKGENVR
jgi:hypothetical protein